MTTQRDFDRIADAWLDLMPSEAPDRAIDSVLEAVERTPQIRRPVFGLPWRSPMNRLTILAASVAVLAIAIVGGAMLFAGGTTNSVPTIAPTPTTTPTRSVTAEPVGEFPQGLWGLWVAEAEPIPGLPDQGSRITALFNWDGGRDFSAGTNFIDGSTVLTSDALGSSPNQFRLRVRDNTDGCVPGDVGTYAWQRSADGLFLTVSALSDPCTVRATTLARTWVRTLGVANDGRTGMTGLFHPYPDIQVTLPEGRWAMDALPPIDIHTYADGDPSRDLLIYVNPQGFGEPCSTPGSLLFPLDPSADALAAYLRGLPGMGAVTSEAGSIDGQPATHLTTTAGECQDAELGLMTQPSFPGSNGGPEEVRVTKGRQISLWTVVRDGDLVVFWYAGDNVPAAEEQAVIDSIRFTDGLPTP